MSSAATNLKSESNAESYYLVNIKLPLNYEITLKNSEDISAWLESEEAYLKSLNIGFQLKSNTHDFLEIRRGILEAVANSNLHIQEAEKSKNFTGWGGDYSFNPIKKYRDQIIKNIYNYYREDSSEGVGIPHHDSSLRGHLPDFLQQFSDQLFRKAVFEGFIFPKNQKYSFNQTSSDKNAETGRIIGQIFRSGLLPNKPIPAELSNQYEKRRAELSILIGQAEELSVQVTKQLEDARLRQQEFLDKSNEEFKNLLENKKEEFSGKLSKVFEQLEEFKDKINKATALKGPLEYWKNKSETHKIRANKALTHLGYTGVASVVSLISLGYFFSDKFTTLAKVNVLHSAFLIVGITAWLWVVKTLMRNYLSNTHLMNDAEERVAMTQSYLAFQESGVQLGKDATMPILNALFRPAGDGIVKEEPPPLAILELLTKSSK